MKEKLINNRKNLFFLFTIFHFTIVVFSTFLGGYSTAKEYFHERTVSKEDSLEPDLIQKTVRSFLNTPGITPYAIIAGIDAGYGFFAPNVASSYIIECAIKNRTGEIISRQYTPNLSTQEARNRYETLVSDFQERMKALEKANEKTLYTRYLDIVLKKIGQNIYDQSSVADKSNGTVTLYLYKYPNLNDYIAGNRKPVLISLVAFDIN
ncbi:MULTISPECIES: hypothetical protein [Sphingobacterium]|jgi:hypothetical protein|uniref:Uncharacterized protein n=1 Tax=Sphingobacterium multivorum TaxID=28454 RepID=A0A653XK12_SPHMU|nr:MULTISPECIES: hypothetical protein [Sphingobacterium]OFV18965.1 hypothetical protein HMPREF3127_05980 [Sphingobacterium sp. HMSC13C05]QIH31511.1 hypothetical protein G6053_00680 [Sphingobacterium sp. DR205]VXC30444.1 conserved hypothetical protein [Sphingobacterium multivorum]HAK30633.1 hypothetical protein [Sphingobacterium sp.]